MKAFSSFFPTWEWLKTWLKERDSRISNGSSEQAIRTKYIRKSIGKEEIDSKCTMCGERDETVAHVLAECKMLTQRQYNNWRHSKVAQALHWEI